MREFIVLTFYWSYKISMIIIIMKPVLTFTTSHSVLLQDCGGAGSQRKSKINCYLQSISPDLSVCLSETNTA